MLAGSTFLLLPLALLALSASAAPMGLRPLVGLDLQGRGAASVHARSNEQPDHRTRRSLTRHNIAARHSVRDTLASAPWTAVTVAPGSPQISTHRSPKIGSARKSGTSGTTPATTVQKPGPGEAGSPEDLAAAKSTLDDFEAHLDNLELQNKLDSATNVDEMLDTLKKSWFPMP